VADKDKELTREQKAWIASQGLLPSQYEVLQDCPHSMAERRRACLNHSQIPNRLGILT